METDGKQSLLGLDRNQSFFERLFLFLATLILGPLLGLLLLLAVMVNQLSPIWTLIAKISLEILGVFWISVLIFIWWRPSWLRRHYLAVERKAVFIVKTAAWVALIWFGSLVAWDWFRAMKFL
jgi:hypothetical protein